jgi:hypothetical protein
MSEQDEVMARIAAAVALSQSGERAAARHDFAAIWGEISPGGDPFHRCTLAHYMADLQDDPHEELRWDLRAIEAAGSLTDERVQAYHESMRILAFYPSLHLNLAEDYRRLGDAERAREHLFQAQQKCDALDDGDYANGIKAAIARLADRLAETA